MEESLIRNNLMTRPGYTPYCGNNISRHEKGGCDNPKTIFKDDQFHCIICGWVSEFPKDFITRYKEHWGIETKNYGTLIDPEKYYPVSYIIDSKGNKVIMDTQIFGRDMTENQIKEYMSSRYIYEMVSIEELPPKCYNSDASEFVPIFEYDSCLGEAQCHYPTEEWIGWDKKVITPTHWLRKTKVDKSSHNLKVLVWDWIITKDGRIIQVIHDDMQDLKYEDILRHATNEEIIKAGGKPKLKQKTEEYTTEVKQLIDVLNHGIQKVQENKDRDVEASWVDHIGVLLNAKEAKLILELISGQSHGLNIPTEERSKDENSPRVTLREEAATMAIEYLEDEGHDAFIDAVEKIANQYINSLQFPSQKWINKMADEVSIHTHKKALDRLSYYEGLKDGVYHASIEIKLLNNIQ